MSASKIIFSAISTLLTLLHVLIFLHLRDTWTNKLGRHYMKTKWFTSSGCCWFLSWWLGGSEDTWLSWFDNLLSWNWKIFTKKCCFPSREYAGRSLTAKVFDHSAYRPLKRVQPLKPSATKYLSKPDFWPWTWDSVM